MWFSKKKDKPYNYIDIPYYENPITVARLRVWRQPILFSGEKPANSLPWESNAGGLSGHCHTQTLRHMRVSTWTD